MDILQFMAYMEARELALYWLYNVIQISYDDKVKLELTLHLNLNHPVVCLMTPCSRGRTKHEITKWIENSENESLWCSGYILQATANRLGLIYTIVCLCGRTACVNCPQTVSSEVRYQLNIIVKNSLTSA